MPMLAKLIEFLFGGLIAGIAARIGQKVIDRALVVAALTAATSALMLLFNTQVAPMAASLFSTSYGQFLGLAFPPVAGSCLAALALVWVGCNTYKLVERTVTVHG